MDILSNRTNKYHRITPDELRNARSLRCMRIAEFGGCYDELTLVFHANVEYNMLRMIVGELKMNKTFMHCVLVVRVFSLLDIEYTATLFDGLKYIIHVNTSVSEKVITHLFKPNWYWKYRQIYVDGDSVTYGDLRVTPGYVKYDGHKIYFRRCNSSSGVFVHESKDISFYCCNNTIQRTTTASDIANTAMILIKIMQMPKFIIVNVMRYANYHVKIQNGKMVLDFAMFNNICCK